MEYANGKEIILGDIIEISMPEGMEVARVVMLGESYERLELEKSFEEWVLKDSILDNDSIVVEWVGRNPLEHNDPNYAPVGNYMFTGIGDDITLKHRAKA
ncbi:MAG: hypothetical protein KZQ87_08840 [Candidatus Thiodiazotropha sp. (ex Cardiolucina cf. quadrata)]|nr:hypothetical protein [Candidatus Thiodiazotropha sp. (ex Cardiolucina cf. quadrata)]